VFLLLAYWIILLLIEAVKWTYETIYETCAGLKFAAKKSEAGSNQINRYSFPLTALWHFTVTLPPAISSIF